MATIDSIQLDIRLTCKTQEGCGLVHIVEHDRCSRQFVRYFYVTSQFEYKQSEMRVNSQGPVV